jgi:hypothetical protein
MEYYPERPLVTYESKYGGQVADFDPLAYMNLKEKDHLQKWQRILMGLISIL